ncbi:MAG: methyl-accepting chemotaxis protein, partial [Angelakisella sp.]
MKSIKQKILIPALVTMMAAMMITTTYSTTSTYKSTMSTLDQTMTEAVKIAAGQSSEAMGKVTAVVTEFADTARLKNSELSDTEKQAILNDKLKLGYFESISMTKSNGISLLGINLSDRDYIQYCLTEKKPYITDPFFSQELNKMTIVVAAPSFVGEQVVGVVYGVMDANYLSSITNTINVGETGTAYMVNNQGVTIAYNDESMVLSQYNTQAEALNDPDLLQLAALEAKMVAGEVGFGTYTYGGVGRLMAFAPIPNTHGWSIAITAAEKEFMQGTVNSIMVASTLLVVFLVMASFILFKISSSIANPIKQCAIRLKQLAEGDLSSPVAHFSSKDETGILAAATESIVDTLNVIISDEDYLLGAMANGDFDIRSRATDRYVGDFQSLLLSIRNINTNLSNTLSQINEAADQVSGGSDQVSDGAQALSQGATEQASSIEELSATITEIASQVKANAGNAANAKNISLKSANEVENGNRQMQQMISAMAEISSTSGQ